MLVGELPRKILTRGHDFFVGKTAVLSTPTDVETPFTSPPWTTRFPSRTRRSR